MRQIDSIRRFAGNFEQELEEVAKQVAAESFGLESSSADSPDLALEVLRGSRRPESVGGEADARMLDYMEAIILDRLRPAYFIQDDEILIAGAYDHAQVLEANKEALETIARGVGRVDLVNHRTLSYGGTGWLVDEDIVVTNRHVAEIFTEKDWIGRYRFAQGAFDEQMEARMNYVRQHRTSGINRRADVLEVLYIAGPREPDIALLRVETRDDLKPLELFTGSTEPEQPVAAVGYPAWDGGRNDPVLMERLFEGVYDVKRFSPGIVMDHRSDGVIVLGDYTSLGGNSGSPVLDLASGKAVGLHFAGAFRDTNYSVAADVVAAALARTRIGVTVPADLATEAPTSRPEAFAGRNGYAADFLGSGDLSVPLPGLGAHAPDVAPVSDSDDGVLRYRNFSVIQSASRRLPLLTAVNIDGDKTFRLRRQGTWSLDGRLAPEHQIGNELYRHNPLDRGHLVRRRDPGWGATREEAQQAEIDTFHYTNSAPQHKDLNQKDWLGLEDYILEAAETKDFKVSVFTGPIFRDTDRTLRSQDGAEDIPIPEEFWKIAVMVNADTGKLSATGYVLTQGRMIRDLTEAAFVLGKYETYQVQIARIEDAAGLDFGALRDSDPMGAELDREAVFTSATRRIGAPSDLLL
ncbi:DNA/RNA non-specific endonuclease [Thiocapsa bogorovii]|uniref:DNA/RNA non-specific endonuclease n=1 Tax=Thiocapsa bogorovii TaxID=521689 RepID=UPI001E291624|nr:DNA/RNA non-specific endonuclease [Thiocapsa bogorovii]UHD16367.1 DNA/RNA non-specific endonuclease [Thiocapsa bogorovii]